MADVMMLAIPSLHAGSQFRHYSVCFCKEIQNYFVSESHSIVQHKGNMYFLLKCRFHLVIPGDIEKLLQKMNAFCFTTHNLDCFYTVLNYCFSSKYVARSRQLIDNVQMAFYFNQENRAEERMPSIE